MNTENTLFEKINNLIRNSVMLKLVTITILMLLLLIPASMIHSIIEEREKINEEVTEEVSTKWAHKQQINGPVLTIPVIYEYEKEKEIVSVTKYWHLLPDNLIIDGTIHPKMLNRGIYEVVVYKSELEISGDFRLDKKPAPLNLKDILYDQAFITVGISDLRGIQNQISFRWNGDDLQVKPGSNLPNLIYSGITIDVPNPETDRGKTSTFSFTVDLQGSRDLSFIPVGNNTRVNVNSSWNSPSFHGNFLPDHRKIANEGFTASWAVLQLNRNFPQTWIDGDYMSQMQESSFGVNLISSLGDYQKSTRAAKYAIMTIGLTFLIFFLVEILNKRKIHPFQYILVGLALCVFYILLVSISEHTSFNFAYLISSAASIIMISLYTWSVFRKKYQAILIFTTLSGIYGFLFVTLQLADYALLMGSLGLTLILGLTMYFTRNINWYKLNIESA